MPIRFDQVRGVRDVVAATLREAILAGRFQPGERLVQDQLAAALRVSRQPVREALSRLESEGLVTQLPQRRAVVREYSESDIRENYLLREVLESEAVRIAADRITAAELEELAALNEAMSRAADPSSTVEINASFHRGLHSAARMPNLVRLIDQLWMGFTVFTPLFIPGRVAHSVREHAKVVRALRERDGARAAAAMREHIERASREYFTHRAAAETLDSSGPAHRMRNGSTLDQERWSR